VDQAVVVMVLEQAPEHVQLQHQELLVLEEVAAVVTELILVVLAVAQGHSSWPFQLPVIQDSQILELQ
jgi:hypothetical protein